MGTITGEIPSPRPLTAEEVGRKKDLLLPRVIPRWTNIGRALKIVIWRLYSQQVLCDMLHMRFDRNKQLGNVPSGRPAASEHKTMMTLNRESVKKVGDTEKCPHLRKHLIARGGNNVSTVVCQECGMQWNRGLGMAKQNLRAPALVVEADTTIPPPRCPLPECRKEMILRQGKESVFWGCLDFPEPRVKTAATKSHCNFALSCYQSPPYQLMLFRDNLQIRQMEDQAPWTGATPIPDFPTGTIASTLWIEAGATVEMINQRSWLECQLSEKVFYTTGRRAPRSVSRMAPTSTITIDEDASSSTAMSAGDPSKEWDVVTMEIEPDKEEQRTIQAFQEMTSNGGMTIEKAALQVSTQPALYLYNSQVGAAIAKIINQMERDQKKDSSR